MPIFSTKPNRGVHHGLLALLNLLIASVFAGFTTECSIRRLNYMSFDRLDFGMLPHILLQILVAISYESIVEYYWHRLMHTKIFYATFHKYHHFYKSPEPWDDMYIHPLEAFGYYCILYGPPFLFKIHYSAFIAYMIIMGIFGISDHSGVKFAIPGLYNTVDHDNHHLKFEVNYSFPFPYMDLLHGTFDGEIFGYSIKPSKA
jgi:sterol desaturase/sphingolipid hydroxylase (fatty acid hydroxylase superfamily)